MLYRKLKFLLMYVVAVIGIYILLTGIIPSSLLENTEPSSLQSFSFSLQPLSFSLQPLPSSLQPLSSSLQPLPPSTPLACKPFPPANQTLHREINELPIERFILRSPQIKANSSYRLVLLVNNAVNEYREREEIRRGWANKNESEMLRTGRAVVIFLVGRSSNLDKEATTNGDILQVDIEETYRNMVYKLECGYRWIAEHLRADFVAKIDLDSVVHVDRLSRHLILFENEERNKQIRSFLCYSFVHTPPIRDKCSDWYVSYEDYAPDNWPPFCNGPSYIMHKDVFKIVLDEIRKHKVIEPEDAFFTGISVHGKVGIASREDIISEKYTEYSNCNAEGPTLSILMTHYQFGSEKSVRNLTKAWNQLKKPICKNVTA